MGVIDQTMPSTSRGHESILSMPVSPEVEHSSKKSGRPLNRPLRDEEIISLLNYGSEEDSDSESEGMARLMISRVERMRMQEPHDELETPANSAPTPDLPTTVPMEPNNKFNFDWRAFPEPQIEPRLRRETFSQINSGPKVSFTSPYEAFVAILDRDIIDLIVRETNIYAQQPAATMLESGVKRPNSRITRWQETTVNEIYIYLAIILSMGMVVKSRLQKYWNTSTDNFRTPGFSDYISYDGFMLLLKCRHLS